MKSSVCTTVYNEENSIALLLNSLLNQSKKPDEIIIVDSESSDDTAKIVKEFQLKNKLIKLIVQKSSRAEGRNIAIKNAQNEIIAVTDAGCVPKIDWLEKITLPFANKNTEVVAGFYEMLVETSFQKACSVFLGVPALKFNAKYLPSARSIAFKSKIWAEVGGFPEDLSDTAEDTMFVYKLTQMNKNITRVKDAVVIWKMPHKINEFVYKMYSYAKGDAETRLFYNKSKGLSSHNIKVLSIFLRYLLFFYLIFALPPIGVFIILTYIFWAFWKVYIIHKSTAAGVWGPVLQILSDIAVMTGFLVGIKAK